LPTLDTHRKITLLTYFFKILNGSAPPYLSKNCPKFLKDATCYSLRHPLNVKISFARTSILKKSFFYHASNLWNFLPPEIQESKSMSYFALRLKKFYGINSKPNLTHLIGNDSKFTAIHCMLRMGHSPLNTSKRYRKCICGETENLDHLMFRCKLIENIRSILLGKIENISLESNTKLNEEILIKNKHLINLLLNGSGNLSYHANLKIFLATKCFLRQGNRFKTQQGKQLIVHAWSYHL